MEFTHLSFTYSVPPPSVAEAANNAAKQLQKQGPPGWSVVPSTTYAGLQKQIATLQKQKLQDDEAIALAKLVIAGKNKELDNLTKGETFTIMANDSAAQAKQIREMANNIVDLVAENSELRKRNKIMEQRNAEDALRITSMLKDANKLPIRNF